MRTFNGRLAWVAVAAAAVLVLSGCRDSTSASTTDEAVPEPPAKAAGPIESSEPQPADYVRFRCDACQCRVFVGDGANCTRPACDHHWRHHQRPPQGS